jgi:hypothetical protein
MMRYESIRTGRLSRTAVIASRDRRRRRLESWFVIDIIHWSFKTHPDNNNDDGGPQVL